MTASGTSAGSGRLKVVSDESERVDQRAAAVTAPVVEPAPPVEDLDDPRWYLNRELTWLEFNRRVLHEARDRRTPLLERVKFAAIVSANLDEFFMKRIGGLKQQSGAGVNKLTVDGRTPTQQIAEACAMVRGIEADKETILREILADLAEHGVRVRSYDELGPDDRQRLREHYSEVIFPLVTPQAVDPAHPFPFISNLSLNLLVSLSYEDDSEPMLARVKVPVGGGVPRFLRVGDALDFVPLEEVMSSNLDLLFPRMRVQSCETFQVIRNANTERNEERADDLLSLIETEVRDRKFAPIVRAVVREGMDPYRRGMLAAELGLDEETDLFATEGMIAMRDLFELAAIDLPELHDAPHHPAKHHRLVGAPKMFYVIREAGSLLLQHPYESFSASVERFLGEASRDPKVRAIKMTLYRTSSKSKVIDSLIEAARNGKQVAVVVELKARFDEAANIRWASRMEDAGIHVTYGVVGLKTHCKLILVVRADYDGLRLYAHIGTGNYHAGTARLYDDLGLLTSDRAIGRDLVELFNYLTTGYTPRRNYRKLLPAPKLLKRSLLDRIEREIAIHGERGGGLIQFKINALEDVDLTRALYRASIAGVHVDIIARDTCRLRPGVPGLSENVNVVSVVGRFLEHSRIYYFRNGGDEEFYIGSADAMMRNLEHRVEVVVPVEEPSLREELRTVIDLHLADTRSAWDMQPDGSYVQRTPATEQSIGCQQALIVRAEAREREARRLRRRKTLSFGRRNR